MASSDWIKMRTGIDRDPRVIAMADALAASAEFSRQMFPSHARNTGEGVLKDASKQLQHASPALQDCFSALQPCFTTFQRNVIVKACVAGLLTVWGVVRDQGKADDTDARLDMATAGTLDHLSGLPGFGEAMARVGWVRAEQAEGHNHLIFPDFLTENRIKQARGTSARSEYQRAYRAKKKAEQATASNMGEALTEGEVKHARNTDEGVLKHVETVLKQAVSENETGSNREIREEKIRGDLKPLCGPPAADGLFPKSPDLPPAQPDPKPKARKPREPDPLFDAIAQATASDPHVSGSHVARVKALLAGASPPYTPDEVGQFARRFLEFCPWAAKDARTRPTLGEVEKYVGQIRVKPASAHAAGRVGRVDPAPGKYDGFDCSGSGPPPARPGE